MLWVGMGGHRSLLMVMVWVWVQIRRKCWALLTCESPKPRRSSEVRVSNPSVSTAKTTVSAAFLAKGAIDCSDTTKPTRKTS